MTPKEIATALGRLEPWFHCIDQGAGLKTKASSVMRAGWPARNVEAEV